MFWGAWVLYFPNASLKFKNSMQKVDCSRLRQPMVFNGKATLVTYGSQRVNRDSRIYLIPFAIARTPTLHLSHLRASSFFKPIFSVSSSTCFFQVFFDHSRFLLPLSSRFRATLKTLSSSILSTCPYHLTPFAVANQSIASFNPNMSICFSVIFLSTTFWLHMALTIALAVLFKIAFSFSFNTMSHFHTVLLILHSNNRLYLLTSEETYFQATTLHIPGILPNWFFTLAVTATLQPPLAFSLSPK